MTDVPDLNQELFAEKLLPYLPATADEIMRHIGKDRELREAYETCNVGLHLLLHLMREKVFGTYCITKEHGSKVWRSWGQVPDVFDIDDEDLATFTYPMISGCWCGASTSEAMSPPWKTLNRGAARSVPKPSTIGSASRSFHFSSISNSDCRSSPRKSEMVWGTKSRHERGYGTLWDKIRRQVLKRDFWLCQCPICKDEERIKPATEVDHIVPKDQGGTDDMSNLRAVNKECHKLLTMQQKGHKPRRKIGNDGFPI